MIAKPSRRAFLGSLPGIAMASRLRAQAPPGLRMRGFNHVTLTYIYFTDPDGILVQLQDVKGTKDTKTNRKACWLVASRSGIIAL